MIEISCQNIEFFSDERIKTFQVTNKGQVGLLFKIKTNKIKALDARPNTGLIAPGAQSKITVKRTEEVANNLKLQISSIECSEQLTDENFKELWAKYEKNQVINTLAVKIVDREQGHKVETNDKNDSQAEQENNLFSSVKMNEQTETKHEEERKPELEIKAQSILLSDNKLEKDGNLEKGSKPIFENEKIVKSKISEKIEENEGLVMMIESEKKKLAEREKEIENFNKKRLNEKESPSQNSSNASNKITLLITALIFFILGYNFGGRGVGQKVELDVQKRIAEENLDVNKSVDL